MRITVAENEKRFDEIAAWRIIEQILKKKNSVIGLSTGRTTINMHRIVSELYGLHPFDVSGTIFFNVDELTNLPRSYAGSCYAMIRSQLLDYLKIPDERFLMPMTESDDFELESRKFENSIKEHGGADLQILGIGWNGHIGINQPGTPFGSNAWVSPMDEIFEARVKAETGVSGGHKLGGLTLGIKTIMHARRIILAAKGEKKAEVIRQALEMPVTEEVPASVLQLHPNCEVLLDQEAASFLSNRRLA